jgi:hypothetical protein
MTFGPARCACCGSAERVEAHHLYSRAGCPDDLTVWLCCVCQGRAHEMERQSDIVHLTTIALAAKKARGNRTNLAAAQKLGRQANQDAADAFAANVLPIVREMRASGITTMRALAAALNDRGIRTARDGTWHKSTVCNLLMRLPSTDENSGPAMPGVVLAAD